MSGKRINYLIAIIFFVIIIAYTILIWYWPFSEPANTFLADFTFTIMAACGAIPATLILQRFQRGEALYNVWLNVSIALWLWTIAETLFGFLDLFWGEVPPVSIADVFWIIGFLFISLSLYSQAKVVYRQHKTLLKVAIYLMWAGAVLLALWVALSISSGGNFREVFILYFYPFADLVIALMAGLLVFAFSGAGLARPWMSLFVMVISDALYAWAVISGLYNWSNETGNMVSVVIDVLYLISYFILAWGIINQYFLIVRGTSTLAESRPSTH